MDRSIARGFRLATGDTIDLYWLHCQADGEIAGVGGQRYESFSGTNSPSERLFLQERTVGLGNRNNPITRQNRIRRIARRMASGELEVEKDEKLSSERGNSHWDWLRRVYGPLSNNDPHDHFAHAGAKELAPLARITPAALRRAEGRWPSWHAEKHSESYEKTYRALRSELGEGADVERMMRIIPDSAAAAHEEEEILTHVLDGACTRIREARTFGQVAPADAHLLAQVERQADEMLSAAGLSYQAAAGEVDKEIESEGKKHDRDEDRKRGEEARARARETRERAEALLSLDPEDFRALFWSDAAE